MEAAQQQLSSPAKRQSHTHVALFYRYLLANDDHGPSRSSNDFKVLDTSTLQFFQTHANHYLPLLQKHQMTLCQKWGMKGRILISTEGINATLSSNLDELKLYQKEMDQLDLLHAFELPDRISKDHIPNAGKGYLFTNIDWKISTVNYNQVEHNQEPFPDLKVQIVNEIVNTGGAIDAKDIPSHTGKEISPEEFHNILVQAKANGGWVADQMDSSIEKKLESVSSEKKEVVLIDVRNTFEHAIGHFIHPHSNKILFDDHTPYDNTSTPNTDDLMTSNALLTVTKSTSTPAINPNTVTFSHFDSNFCSKYSDILKDKKILMYCTGGIRCVKASAMLKKRGVEDVSQLSGGIHRYLEKYAGEGFFRGKYMVFDQRVALEPDDVKIGGNEKVYAENTVESTSSNVVGKCVECHVPCDQLSGANLCTVCRDLLLICPKCRESKNEYHCERHSSWKNAYYTFIDGFTIKELEKQKTELQQIHDSYGPPKMQKNVRKTLRKQIEKVRHRIEQLNHGSVHVDTNPERRCRTCFETVSICDGLCWGFWKHSQATQKDSNSDDIEPIIEVEVGDRVRPGPHWNEFRLGKKCTISSLPISEIATIGVQSSKQSTRLTLKTGTVVQLKSWGSGGNDKDCVVVLWDNHPSSGCGKRKRRRNQENGSEGNSLNQTAIYRWGVIARNGQRMYDVELLDTPQPAQH